jgi:hypothetical protein
MLRRPQSSATDDSVRLGGRELADSRCGNHPLVFRPILSDFDSDCVAARANLRRGYSLLEADEVFQNARSLEPQAGVNWLANPLVPLEGNLVHIIWHLTAM